jgi:hypothetical protein
VKVVDDSLYCIMGSLPTGLALVAKAAGFINFDSTDSTSWLMLFRFPKGLPPVVPEGTSSGRKFESSDFVAFVSVVAAVARLFVPPVPDASPSHRDLRRREGRTAAINLQDSTSAAEKWNKCFDFVPVLRETGLVQTTEKSSGLQGFRLLYLPTRHGGE